MSTHYRYHPEILQDMPRQKPGDVSQAAVGFAGLVSVSGTDAKGTEIMGRSVSILAGNSTEGEEEYLAF